MIGGLSFGMVSFLSPMEVVVVACAKLAAAAELLEVIGVSIGVYWRLLASWRGRVMGDGWVSTWRESVLLHPPSSYHHQLDTIPYVHGNEDLQRVNIQ